MRQRSSGPRIDTLSRALLAAAVMAAATGAAQAQSPESATGSRVQSPAPAPVQPALTPKRSFDDVTAAQEAAKKPAAAQVPAATATPAPTPAPAQVPAATATAEPAAAPASAPTVIIPTELDTKACIAKLRKGATANGLTVADWDKYTAHAKLLPTTVALSLIHI